MDSEKITENSGKFKKKAEVLEMFGARDNMVISIDCLSASIIRHLGPYFQCRLVQNNLKSETSIIKLRKLEIIVGNPAI